MPASLKLLAKRWLPRPVRSLLKRSLFLPVDAMRWISGKQGDLAPPRGLLSVEGDFHVIGSDFLGHLIELCRLEKSHSVLDVGCGVGRMAVPLTTFLGPSARYEGFDIIPEGIDWCRRKISRRYQNFNFQLVDVYNKNYNPFGRVAAEHFRFPYPDGAFDVVLAASVFTHMLPRDSARYLEEIGRVLRPGGGCLLTFFLADAGAGDFLARVLPLFPHDLGTCWVRDKTVPEVAVCHHEDLVLDALKRSGLQLSEPILRGSWAGRAGTRSYQDLLVATAASAPHGPSIGSPGQE